VEGNIAYFRIGGDPSVYVYDSSNSKWLCIYPECPSIRFGVAVINGLLTAIGGLQDGKVIGTYSVSQEKEETCTSNGQRSSIQCLQSDFSLAYCATESCLS